jgi:hypothetical protein
MYCMTARTYCDQFLPMLGFSAAGSSRSALYVAVSRVKTQSVDLPACSALLRVRGCSIISEVPIWIHHSTGEQQNIPTSSLNRLGIR